MHRCHARAAAAMKASRPPGAAGCRYPRPLASEKMTVTGLNETTHDIQHHTAGWIKHTIQDPSPRTEAAIRWVLSRLGEANVPDVVHAEVLTLTGKKKAAKQARKAAETAVQHAERKLSRTGHRGKAWMAACLLTVAAAVAALAWWGPAGGREPKADGDTDPA
jgi:hypothetical protein